MALRYCQSAFHQDEPASAVPAASQAPKQSVAAAISRRRQADPSAAMRSGAERPAVDDRMLTSLTTTPLWCAYIVTRAARALNRVNYQCRCGPASRIRSQMLLAIADRRMTRSDPPPAHTRDFLLVELLELFFDEAHQGVDLRVEGSSRWRARRSVRIFARETAKRYGAGGELDQCADALAMRERAGARFRRSIDRLLAEAWRSRLPARGTSSRPSRRSAQLQPITPHRERRINQELVKP